jgi:nucleotide-binding universal stress UspA family protein
MFTRILLAVDGTEADEVATSFVTGMARQNSATVRVLHVNEYLAGGRGFARSTDKEAHRIVDRAARSLVVAGVPADGEVRVAYSFDMPTRIAEGASEWAADVIVVGSRRRSRRLFSGQGMREKVTRLTALPVLTVPAPLRLGRGHRLGLEELVPSNLARLDPAMLDPDLPADPFTSGPDRPSRSAPPGRAR